MTLLKVGELDYVFNYASLAKQNGLRMIPLPPEINLGDPKLIQTYRRVSVEISGERPGMRKKIQGEPIIYSTALLKDAPNPKVARAFIDFLLGPQGQSLMIESGMTPLALASR
jgi:molybdate/tungstate transport system substrate-binding protein